MKKSILGVIVGVASIAIIVYVCYLIFHKKTEIVYTSVVWTPDLSKNDYRMMSAKKTITDTVSYEIWWPVVALDSLKKPLKTKVGMDSITFGWAWVNPQSIVFDFNKKWPVK